MFIAQLLVGIAEGWIEKNKAIRRGASSTTVITLRRVNLRIVSNAAKDTAKQSGDSAGKHPWRLRVLDRGLFR
jgi:hypothetical protein